MAETLNYSGEGLMKRPDPFEIKEGEKIQLEAYIPSDDLVEAVNLSINLKRPLLLMGEPGCGKTRLAEAVAYELHGDEMYKHYFRWDIKSITKAKDGIYQYDALKRLYHANLKSNNEKKNVEIEKNNIDSEKKNVEILDNYIIYGKLYKAFTAEQNGSKPNILLIDEIDKADIDFPNDLLVELENRSFSIPELGEAGDLRATSDVLIFITSNQEKELPPAFLRRCLYQFVEFPDKEKLNLILEQYIGKLDKETIEKALKAFNDIRDGLSDLDKKPSTSELIDWFKMMAFYFEKMNQKKDLISKVEQNLIHQLDEFIKNNKYPYLSILLKTKESRQKIESNP